MGSPLPRCAAALPLFLALAGCAVRGWAHPPARTAVLCRPLSHALRPFPPPPPPLPGPPSDCTWQDAQDWAPLALQGGAQFQVNVTAIIRTVNDCADHAAATASLTLNVVDGEVNPVSSSPVAMTSVNPQFTTASYLVDSSVSGTVDMFLTFYRLYKSGYSSNPASTEAVFRVTGGGITAIREEHDSHCDTNPPRYDTYFDMTPYGASATIIVTGKF